MVGKVLFVLMLMLIFTSIGIYSKLLKYNVPKSAVLYAFLIPIISFIRNIQVVNECFDENFKNEKFKDRNKVLKLILYIRIQIFSMKYFKMLNSINILRYGGLKLTFFKFLKIEVFEMNSRKKTNEEIDNSFNCDFSKVLAREFAAVA